VVLNHEILKTKLEKSKRLRSDNDYRPRFVVNTCLHEYKA
jgi:hypothetical protein